jgi:hypothetical protein
MQEGPAGFPAAADHFKIAGETPALQELRALKREA